MGTRIEVMTRGSLAASDGLVLSRPIRVYNIDDAFLPEETKSVLALLADPLVDIASANRSVLQGFPLEEGFVLPDALIEVSPKPGVNDPEGQTARKALEQVLGRPVGEVSFAQQYLWSGKWDDEQFIGIRKMLANPVTREVKVAVRRDQDPLAEIGFHFPYVELPKVTPFKYVDIMIPDNNLVELSNNRLLALNLEEMLTIKRLFADPQSVGADSDYLLQRRKLGLEAMPTDAELEGIAQKWSEHCCHKKLNALWGYTSDDLNDEAGLPTITDSIFKSIIKASTERISRYINWLKSVTEDNSGVIELNRRWNLSHKVESHNHPSGLDGFGGADTGTGGVLRDPGCTGKGMHPVSSQYGFRTPHPDSYKDLPLDIQSPVRTLEGVVAGVEDYGNKFGVPTQCGSVFIDDGWLKPGVLVGCVAVAESEIDGVPTHTKNIELGYIALSLGGRVGKDGVHGATASSIALSADAEQRQDINQSVQIGAPIVEKGVFEAMDALRSIGYIEATQDCGAGGWNSAVGELAELLHHMEKKRYEIQTFFIEQGITSQSSIEERLSAVSEILPERIASPFYDQMRSEIDSGEIFPRKSNGKGGVVMDLTHVLEKYAGLAGWEKLISEAQERVVIVIKPENLEHVAEICKHNNVEATQIAVFDDTGYYHVKDQDTPIVFLPIDFLDQGLPQMRIKAHWAPSKNQEPEIEPLENLTDTLLNLVGRPNMQSYEWIVTRYDHEVQGGSLIKPLVGIGRAKSDTIAYHPVLGENEVVLETWGSNPWQGDIDAHHMGRNSVVDAIGRIVAAGGHLPDRDTYKITFNGNTTCPKPEEDPYVAAQVMRMLKGAADAEEAFNAPTISGKDSTSMERTYTSTETGKNVHVKAKCELLMSAVGVIPDDSTLTTSDFKLPGDLVYIVGETRNELGASEFYLLHGETGRNVPKSDFAEIKERYAAVSNAIKQDLVHSCQYIAKGGLAASLANSSLGGDLGVFVELGALDTPLGTRPDTLLFSESTGRFVVSVHPSNRKEFEESMKGAYLRLIGDVRKDKEFKITSYGAGVVATTVDQLREANKGTITPERLRSA
ncbi:MAG TPA: AIR synthase-related protein [Candidatus Nanoarchaeia archaeon]|nr:AIR synthase-related protein [Candidatus Nanoarchaeia archaeon]